MKEIKSYQEIVTYLQKDAILSKIIAQSKEEVTPSLALDVYFSLLHSIVSQQLSIKVADIIWGRFIDLFIDRYPKAEKLLQIEHTQLRAVGLSNSKANYVKNVAKFSLQNSMDLEFLQSKTDNEIIDYLTQIKGVGRWTAEMILMFPMDRPNVIPLDDLGIQKAMQKAYGFSLEKKELKTKMLEISKNWDPYKTLACKYLWKYISN